MADSTRARRLLALLHLLERDSSLSIEDIARTLGISIEETTTDLELLACCGVAPYYSDELVPLIIENGTVDVFGELPALQRPVRLSRAEANAIAAALQIAGMEPAEPLVARLLEAAADSETSAEDMGRVVRAATSPGARDHFEVMTTAIAKKHVVRIWYRSTGSPVETERDIEPIQMLAERGVWYLEAYCRTAASLRTFRLDRIRQACDTGDSFEPRDLSTSGVVFAIDELPLARVRFAPGEEFSVRDWPGGRVVCRAADGSTEADIPYAGTEWISRQVLARLGEVEVLSPPEVRRAVHELASQTTAGV